MNRCFLAAGAAGLISLVLALTPTLAQKKDEGKLLVLPERNGVNLVDKNVLTDWSVQEGSEKNMLWKAAVGKIAYSGPVVAQGKVFVGTNNGNPRNPKIKGDKGVLMCFDARTGKFLWQAVHDKLGNQDQDFPDQGIASTPVIDENRVYYVSNRCEVVCADIEGDPKTGEAKYLWKCDMIGKLKVHPTFLANSSPLIVGDLVYVITANGASETEGEVASPEAPSFLALNKKTGEVVWSSNLPGKNIIEGQWSSPTFALVNGKPQVIFGGGDGWLYGFEAKKGELIWKFNCSVKEAGNRREKPMYPVATPVVWENKLYLGIGANPDHASKTGHLWCIDITKTGDLSPAEGNFDPKSPANKKSGLVWHFGGTINPVPARGRKVFFGPTLSACCVYDGLVYAAEMDGYLHCLDAHTGQEYWQHDLSTGTWSSPYYVDGKIYLGTDDGDIVIFPHGKVKKEPIKMTVERGVKTPITVADGVIYTVTDTYLYALGKK